MTAVVERRYPCCEQPEPLLCQYRQGAVRRWRYECDNCATVLTNTQVQQHYGASPIELRIA